MYIPTVIERSSINCGSSSRLNLSHRNITLHAGLHAYRIGSNREGEALAPAHTTVHTFYVIREFPNLYRLRSAMRLILVSCPILFP